MSAYWSQWDYSEVMEWVADIEEETEGDFEEDIFQVDEDEYSMPINLDSLGMSWADFM